MKASPDFESAWREVAPRLSRMLAARGVARDIADDVVQETALKLLASWRRIDTTKPLWPLARTAAINCLIDRHRRERALPVEHIPDAASHYDIEEHGLARARLGAVLGAFRMLTPHDRSALVSAVEGARGGTSAVKMARLRARARLRAFAEASGPAFTFVAAPWRRVHAWLQATGELHSASASMGAAAVAVTLVVAPMAVHRGLPVDSHRPAKAEVVSEAQVSEVDRAERPARKPSPDRNTSLRRDGDGTTIAAAAPSSAEDTDAHGHQPSGRSPARVGTEEGRGYKSVHVCAGEDPETGDGGHDLAVTYYDGSQSGSDEPNGCNE